MATTVDLKARGIYQWVDQLFVAHPTDDYNGYILYTPAEWRLAEHADYEVDADGRILFQGQPVGQRISDLIDTRFDEPQCLDDAGVCYAFGPESTQEPTEILLLDFGPYTRHAGGLGLTAAELRNEDATVIEFLEPLARNNAQGQMLPTDWDEEAFRSAVRAVVASLESILDPGDYTLVWDPDRDNAEEDAGRVTYPLGAR